MHICSYFISTHDGNISVWDSNAKGPVVLLFHPNRELFKGLFEKEIADSFRLIALDFLPYAKNREKCASIASSILKQLEISQAVVLGMNAKGRVALEMSHDLLEAQESSLLKFVFSSSSNRALKCSKQFRILKRKWEELQNQSDQLKEEVSSFLIKPPQPLQVPNPFKSFSNKKKIQGIYRELVGLLSQQKTDLASKLDPDMILLQDIEQSYKITVHYTNDRLTSSSVEKEIHLQLTKEDKNNLRQNEFVLKERITPFAVITLLFSKKFQFCLMTIFLEN
jgi:hypothetical protein